jgi:hypothetical protein
VPAFLLWLCCAGLLSGAKKYRDALAAMTEAQQLFAASLAEFGAGNDEESLLLGELAGQCHCLQDSSSWQRDQLAGWGLKSIAPCNSRVSRLQDRACSHGILQLFAERIEGVAGGLQDRQLAGRGLQIVAQ